MGCPKKTQGGVTMKQQVQQKQANQHQAQAQASQQAPIFIRELTIMEVVSMALHKKRVSGKESRRVVLHLRPSLIPPKSGTYQTTIGPVKVFSKFMQEEGRWLLEVKLPNESGFPLGDHIKGNPPSQLSDPQK
jgi:hypothetical protein